MMADPTAKRWYDMMQRRIVEGLKAKVEVVSAKANKKFPEVMTDPRWMISEWQKRRHHGKTQ